MDALFEFVTPNSRALGARAPASSNHRKSHAAGPKRAIASVGNPNMVRNEKDFEMIVIAQGQKQNFAWVAFALIPKIGALLFDEGKLRWMTGLGIDSDRYVEIFDAS